MNKQVKQIIFWVGALIIGAVLGSLHVAAVDSICDFTATVFTRLFKFIFRKLYFFPFVLAFITFVSIVAVSTGILIGISYVSTLSNTFLS